MNTVILKADKDGYAEWNGNKILISGIDFSAFNKNPVVVNGGLGEVVGRLKGGLKHTEKGLEGELEFRANSDFSEMTAAGIMEVGVRSLIPKEVETNEEGKTAYNKTELLDCGIMMRIGKKDV